MVATNTRDELRAKIERGDMFILVETLPADVYQTAHLRGAISLPFEQTQEIMEQAATLLPDKHAVYCCVLHELYMNCVGNRRP